MNPNDGGLHVIGHWITERARLTPHRIAIEFRGLEISYGELENGSNKLAASLLHHGLVPGDRVATLTENRPEHVELFFACAKAGLTLAPLNCHLTAVELANQLDAFSPSLVVASTLHGEKLSEACSLANGVATPLNLEGLIASLDHRVQSIQLPAVGDDDALLLIATSGTTGAPKGALLTHANCFWTNLGLDLSVPISGDDVVLQVLPQFHVGGWNVQPLLAWWKGATVVLESSFEPARVLELVASRRVTMMMGVPTTYLLLAQEPCFNDADLSSLRTVTAGGASMPTALIEQWHARGVEVVQGYGLTEASPNVFCLAPEDAFTHAGWVGKPYAYVGVALFDNATERFVSGAGRGEILVRGPNVFPGYWNNPEATKSTFLDGWLRTGDIAERDAAGYYRICGRNKEMYVSGGENVYPAEVEQVLAAHAQVMEAAVLSVEHPRWGEAGAAFVVVKPGEVLDVNELTIHCRANLAPFKVPCEFHIISELPRSHIGKLDKKRLRESLT
ncbi:MAG TPA: AMP-binding protein [Acidimicrobiales bacterium]